MHTCKYSNFEYIIQFYILFLTKNDLRQAKKLLSDVFRSLTVVILTDILKSMITMLPELRFDKIEKDNSFYQLKDKRNDASFSSFINELYSNKWHNRKPLLSCKFACR